MTDVFGFSMQNFACQRQIFTLCTSLRFRGHSLPMNGDTECASHVSSCYGSSYLF